MESIACMLAAAHCTVCPFAYSEAHARPRVLGSWDAVYVCPCPAEASMLSLLSPISEDESDGIPFYSVSPGRLMVAGVIG